MSTPQRGYQIPMLVPVYLLVIGVGLLVGAGWLFVNSPDELFTACLAAVGGVTMLVTMVLTLTWARSA
jgi:fumarate reductase subunit D